MTQDIGIIELSGRLNKAEFERFLKLAAKANSIGQLVEFVDAYSGMLDEGCDPLGSMSEAFEEAKRSSRGEGRESWSSFL